MPSDFVLKTGNRVHRALQKLSAGRIGWKVGSMPVVELTTTGRRSGRPRTVLLFAPVRHGEAYVVVASRGGDDHHPAWFLNLRDNPEVQAKIRGGPLRPMRARIASAEERASLWPSVVAAFRGYGNYQTKTDREIPLVFLEPA